MADPIRPHKAVVIKAPAARAASKAPDTQAPTHGHPQRRNDRRVSIYATRAKAGLEDEQNSTMKEIIREKQKAEFVRKQHRMKERELRFVGWVYKQGNKSFLSAKFLRPYDLRFLVLTPGKLEWFKKSDDAKPQNSLDITGYDLEHERGWHGKRGGIRLFSTNDDRREFKFYVASRSPLMIVAERTRWRKALLRELGPRARKAYEDSHVDWKDPLGLVSPSNSSRS